MLGTALGLTECEVGDALEIFRRGINLTYSRARSREADILRVFEKTVYGSSLDIQTIDMAGLVTETRLLMSSFQESIIEHWHDAADAQWQFSQAQAALWLTPGVLEEWKEVHTWLSEHGHDELQAIAWLKVRVHSWHFLRDMVHGLKGPEGNASSNDELALRDWLQIAVRENSMVSLTHAHTHTHTCTLTCTHTRTHTHTRSSGMRLYAIQIHTHTYTHIHTHTHPHTNEHTHIHTKIGLGVVAGAIGAGSAGLACNSRSI